MKCKGGRKVLLDTTQVIFSLIKRKALIKLHNYSLLLSLHALGLVNAWRGGMWSRGQALLHVSWGRPLPGRGECTRLAGCVSGALEACVREPHFTHQLIQWHPLFGGHLRTRLDETEGDPCRREHTRLREWVLSRSAHLSLHACATAWKCVHRHLRCARRPARGTSGRRPLLPHQ